MKRLQPLVLLATFAACLAVPARAQIDQFTRNLVVPPGDARPSTGTDDGRIGSGLKEALQVATEKAIGSTGRPNGYLDNAAIRIPMPEKLQSVEKGLRMAGLGAQADEFIASMNHAAEQSAPAARPIFVEAIRGIGFDDARRILGGGDTAATDYFRRATRQRLAAAFTPIVQRNMDEVGVTHRYHELMAAAETLPFVKSQSFDIDAYVVGKALDGLFHEMAAQERLIRRDPAARSTELLKEIFTR